MNLALTLPKRLRYFVHRDPRLIGPISRILTRELAAFYRAQAGASRESAPAVYVVFMGAIVVNTIIEKPVEALWGLGIVLLGLPLYYWLRRPAPKA